METTFKTKYIYMQPSRAKTNVKCIEHTFYVNAAKRYNIDLNLTFANLE